MLTTIITITLLGSLICLGVSTYIDLQRWRLATRPLGQVATRHVLNVTEENTRRIDELEKRR